MQHPLYVRITHWINAIAMLLMIASGWKIYNAAPLFSFALPESFTIGRWLGGALLWHFAAMWLLVANGLAYVILSIASGRLVHTLLPLRPRDVAADLAAALRGRLGHAQGAYNAVQKLFYLGVLASGVLIVFSGLAMWKPVQLRALAALMGGYEGARLVHFCAMAAIVAFLCVHVVMALLVPRSLRAMTLGR